MEQNKWSNKIQVVNGIGLLTITSGEYSETHLFSTKFLDFVSGLHWGANGGYAETHLPRTEGAPRTKIYLHHLPWLGLGMITRRMTVDHLNGNKKDSRLENLDLGPHRRNMHNISNQSIYGANILLNNKGKSYRVQIRFRGGGVIFRPNFRSLEDARKCKEEYLKIAIASDADIRPIPSRDELIGIAEEIRGWDTPARWINLGRK